MYLAGGGVGGGVTSEKAAKRVTAVQESESAFLHVSVTPLDIYKETSGQFSDKIVTIKHVF